MKIILSLILTIVISHSKELVEVKGISRFHKPHHYDYYVKIKKDNFIKNYRVDRTDYYFIKKVNCEVASVTIFKDNITIHSCLEE